MGSGARRRNVSLLVIFGAFLAAGCTEAPSSTATPAPAPVSSTNTETARGCPLPDWASRYALVGTAELCGGCDTNCQMTRDLPDQNDLDTHPSIDAQGVAYDGAAGGVVIGTSSGTRGLYAWIANSWESTVTKVTLDTPRTAVGVYRVGLSSQHNPGGGNWDFGNRPSRTAVDSGGNAYVLSRGLDGGWTVVTKIAGDLADCVDLNANLAIDTSSGLGDILGWPNESNQDECILWSVTVGPIDGGGRAISIDAMNRIWVGLHDHQQFVVLDHLNGAELARVNVDWSPYGAAIGPDGTLWMADHAGASGQCHIQPIDTNAANPTDADVGPAVNTPNRPYGVVIDQFNRVFVADKEHGGVNRYDPSTDSWVSGNDPNCSTTSGIALSAEGYIYGACFNDSFVSVYDGDTMALLDSYDTGAHGGMRPWGVCADFDGNVWAANFDSPDVTVLRYGVGVVELVPVQGLSYTYSDFTGYSNMTFVAATASLVRDYDAYIACGAGNPSMRYGLSYQAEFPDGGELHFYGRAAGDMVTLEAQPEVDLGTRTDPVGFVPIDSIMDMATPSQPTEVRHFQLRIELVRGVESPVLQEYTLQEYCQ